MDILNLILAFLGVYGLVYALRLFLPRNIVPRVSELLDKTMALFKQAEAINIPNVSDYRASLAMYVHIYLSTSPRTYRTQPSQPVLADAYGEPSLSRVFPAALPAFSVRSDLEAQ
jgi:hypothetical protein